MSDDKYSATWVSHSSMGDFKKCPRAYYLNNVYKDPRTRRKISLINPQLALGQVVHKVLESLAEQRIPAETRMNLPLLEHLDTEWHTITGIKGGFTNGEYEQEMKERAVDMISYVKENPGPLARKALTLPSGTMLPHYYISREENIILCGKIDWLEYLPDHDGVHIIDFKTGKHVEDDSSLQLPIYFLLTTELQKRPVIKASYWYLDQGEHQGWVEKDLPSYETAHQKVVETARQVKQARENKQFECPHGTEGCFACRPFEAILQGEATYVGVNEINQDMYAIL